MAEERLSGGQALVRSLVGEGVDVVFGLPGVQLDWVFDALYEARDCIRVYHTRHEQATAYMADGYARTTGNVGVCMVVPGPGLLNASAALATAFACSSRVLCVTGQVDSRGIDRGFGLLHEIPHQESVLAAVTTWSGRALEPGQVPGLVREAFRRLRSGRPRPVALELPPDVLQRFDDVHLLDSAPAEQLCADPDKLRQAAALLHAAQRPVIYSGGGVLAAGAWRELRALAELLEAAPYRIATMSRIRASPARRWCVKPTSCWASVRASGSPFASGVSPPVHRLFGSTSTQARSIATAQPLSASSAMRGAFWPGCSRSCMGSGRARLDGLSCVRPRPPPRTSFQRIGRRRSSLRRSGPRSQRMASPSTI